MRILFLDVFHGGSHAAVADGYARHSRNEVVVESLPIDGGWRWRMRGAAVTLARRVREQWGGGGHGGSGLVSGGSGLVSGGSGLVSGGSGLVSGGSGLVSGGSETRPFDFDLIIATDMLDLATFLGLTRDLTAGVPIAVYFHENQLTYPLPEGRTRDLAFPWTNYTTALAADAVVFNSAFHQHAFLAALPGLLNRFHDHRELDLIDTITARSHVLHPGIDLTRLTPGVSGQGSGVRKQPFTLLWNSRWEYDKNPAAFFAALAALEARGVDFRVIVAGEHIDPNHADFVVARARFASRTIAWGYAPDTASYARLLHQADVVVSTAVQEFFGISLVEAMACGCVPVAPRRLAYPEVIPAAIHHHCLYNNDADMVEKLIAAAGLPPEVRTIAQTAAAHYDWSGMAPRYDALFESLVDGT